MRLPGGTILQPVLVAAQALFDHQERQIGAGIGIGSIGVGFQGSPGIQMQRAIGAEAEAVLAQRDMAGEIAVEIFAQDLLGTLADPAAQRLADTDAFSRNPQSHGRPRLDRFGGIKVNPIWPRSNRLPSKFSETSNRQYKRTLLLATALDR